jgi:hypothetical protein
MPRRNAVRIFQTRKITIARTTAIATNHSFVHGAIKMFAWSCSEPREAKLYSSQEEERQSFCNPADASSAGFALGRSPAITAFEVHGLSV